MIASLGPPPLSSVVNQCGSYSYPLCFSLLMSPSFLFFAKGSAEDEFLCFDLFLVTSHTECQDTWSKITSVALSLLSTLVASLATLPFSCAFFYQASFLGVANLNHVPFTTFVLMPVLLIFVLSIMLSCPGFLSGFTHVCLDFLCQLAHIFMPFPMPHFKCLRVNSGPFLC